MSLQNSNPWRGSATISHPECSRYPFKYDHRFGWSIELGTWKPDKGKWRKHFLTEDNLFAILEECAELREVGKLANRPAKPFKVTSLRSVHIADAWMAGDDSVIVEMVDQVQKEYTITPKEYKAAICCFKSVWPFQELFSEQSENDEESEEDSDEIPAEFVGRDWKCADA